MTPKENDNYELRLLHHSSEAIICSAIGFQNPKQQRVACEIVILTKVKSHLVRDLLRPKLRLLLVLSIRNFIVSDYCGYCVLMYCCVGCM